MLNCLSITGRIVETPELRHTKSEIPVTTFRIACQRDTVSQSAERKTDFFDVVVWRQTAEFVCRNFAKGVLITLVGRIENRQWEDKEGNKRVSTEIIAHTVYFGESKKKDVDNGTQPEFNPFEDEEDNDENLP